MNSVNGYLMGIPQTKTRESMTIKKVKLPYNLIIGSSLRYEVTNQQKTIIVSLPKMRSRPASSGRTRRT